MLSMQKDVKRYKFYRNTKTNERYIEREYYHLPKLNYVKIRISITWPPRYAYKKVCLTIIKL